MGKTRDVYYVSGSTAILAEDMGKALLAQFQGIRFREEKIPFIHTSEDAQKALDHILSQSRGHSPLVFCTIMNEQTLKVFDCEEIEFYDIFLNTLERLESSLNAEAIREPGYSRHFTIPKMNKRVDAIHFSLEHDDGTKTNEYENADIILVGVSRSGKTPVSIYLATHMQLKAANFPLTEDHLDDYELPRNVARNRQRVIGLTCSPRYLHKIREKRYSGSYYASLANCTGELNQARRLFTQHNITVLNVEGRSIEELAVQAVQAIGRKKRRTRSGQQRISR